MIDHSDDCPFFAGNFFLLNGAPLKILEAGATKNVSNAPKFPWVLKLAVDTARQVIHIAVNNSDLDKQIERCEQSEHSEC